jgi:hypothetical protein
MCYLVGIEDYNNGCMPIAINLYFNEKIFEGTADLLAKNGYLFQANKLGKVRCHDDRYHSILAKEVNYNNKIFVRNFIYRQNLHLTKPKLDEEIIIYLKKFKKLIVDISFMNETNVKEAHFYFAKIQGENDVLFMDGQGTWPVLRKLERNYGNLKNISLSTYVEKE